MNDKQIRDKIEKLTEALNKPESFDEAVPEAVSFVQKTEVFRWLQSNEHDVLAVKFIAAYRKIISSC